MSAQYAAWIPNVAGRLSFSHIGQTRHPAPCRVLNEDDGSRRLVVCAQRRVLGDALVSPGYFKFVYAYDPTWYFVLVAQSESEGSDQRARLVGEVFAFSDTRWIKGVDPHEAGEPIFSDLLEEGEIALQSAGGAKAFDTGACADLVERLRKAATYSVKCSVSRDGVTELESTSSADPIFFSTGIANQPEQLGEAGRRYLANQVYFFLKDISHHHRHHHRKADTITAAHPNDSEGTWMRETQYSIHRRVIEKRRSPSPLTLYEALGVMAYLKSFRESVTRRPSLKASEVIGDYN